MPPRSRQDRVLRSSGYVMVFAPNHPLARRRTARYEYEHRIVFYNTHGEGPFRCYWCGRQIDWMTMHVDHLDKNRSNNEPGNLVSSCPVCNQGRGRGQMVETMRRRRGRTLRLGEIEKTVSEWARALGISRSSIVARLSAGWPIQRALTEPRGKFGPTSR